MNQESLVTYLKEKISNYVTSKKFHSLMTLSTKSGVPYNTVRRIANGQVDKPTMETALALLNVVEPRSTLLETVERFFPGVGQILAASHALTGSEFVTDAMIDLMTEDQVSYRIFSLAGTRVGTTRQDISRLFGEDGLRKLDILLEQGVVEMNPNHVIHTKVEDYSTVNPNALLRKMRHCLDFFDKTLLGTDGALLAIQTESVNEDGLKAIKQATKDYYFTLTKIRKDPQFYGDIPFYANVCIGLFDSQKYRLE